MTQAADIAALRNAFAPTGTLRACINLGNPILAKRNAQGHAEGVSVDLARQLGERLGVPAGLLVVETAAASVQAVADGAADVGFFAIDPLRGQSIAFTAAYVLIEGCYLVRNESPLQRNEEVDAPGTTVMVGKGSAYDLYLTREIKRATLMRAPSSPAVVQTFLDQKADVAAGVKQQLEMDAKRLGGLRLLPDRFMVIRQAMGCPKAKGPEAAGYLVRYVEEMKANGFVAQALARHSIEGASVAPASPGGV